ncbi:MAG: DUF86 domain-containing protein [Firmicutes bacterium]|nr:DUF86 domain-containing protein [Bacillota bacterium]
MRDSAYIERMIKYAQKISNYLLNVESFDEFESNDEKIDAVIMNLEQIGETARKLSLEAKHYYKNINWPSIIGLRNMISHEYEGIKLLIIYEIAIKSIPDLLIKLRDEV